MTNIRPNKLKIFLTQIYACVRDVTIVGQMHVNFMRQHFGAGILADQIACRIAKSSVKSQQVFGYGFWFCLWHEKEKTSQSIALAWPKQLKAESPNSGQTI